jgi:hypothetical protein
MCSFGLQLTFLSTEVKCSILLSVPGESDRALPYSRSLVDSFDLVRYGVVFSLERVGTAVLVSGHWGVDFRRQHIIPINCIVCSFVQEKSVESLE